MPLISDEDLRRALAGLPGWELLPPTAEAPRRLAREYRLPSFRANIALVQRIADLAEEQDHHPDLLIRYRTLRIELHSHDSGGVTERDVRLAGAIEGLWREETERSRGGTGG